MEASNIISDKSNLYTSAHLESINDNIFNLKEQLQNVVTSQSNAGIILENIKSSVTDLKESVKDLIKHNNEIQNKSVEHDVRIDSMKEDIDNLYKSKEANIASNKSLNWQLWAILITAVLSFISTVVFKYYFEPKTPSIEDRIEKILKLNQHKNQ